MLLTLDAGSRTSVGKSGAINAARPSQPVITPLLDALGLSDDTSWGDRRDPDWADAHVGIVEQAERLASDHPDNPTALARLSQALRNAGRVDEAVETARRTLEITSTGLRFEECVVSRPDAASSYVASAILAAEGHLEEVEHALERSADDPLHRLLWAATAAERGDFRTAMERLDQVEGNEASSLRGWLLLRDGEPALAVRAFRSTLASGAPSPAVLTNLAYAYAAVGSLGKAIRSARASVALAPSSREMSYGLVGHLLNAGQLDEAKRELDRLAELLGGDDADAVLLRASIALRAGTDREALRVLRSGRSRVRRNGSPRAFAELAGNIAYFEWKVGERTLDQALSVVRRVARRADGVSVAVVCLLADLANTTAALQEVREQIEKAAQHHERDELLPALAREAHLSADFRRELDTARAWARAQPLDGSAAAVYIYLIGQVEGDFEKASREGLRALQRTPYSDNLRNNTAYVLAMAGRGRDALEVIEPIRSEGFVPLATEGLALLSMGRVQEGCSRYREAADRIADTGGTERSGRLRALLALHMKLAIVRFEIEDEVSRCNGWLPTSLPDDWRTDPQLLLIHSVLARLGVQAE